MSEQISTISFLMIRDFLNSLCESGLAEKKFGDTSIDYLIAKRTKVSLLDSTVIVYWYQQDGWQERSVASYPDFCDLFKELYKVTGVNYLG